MAAMPDTEADPILVVSRSALVAALTSLPHDIPADEIVAFVDGLTVIGTLHTGDLISITAADLPPLCSCEGARYPGDIAGLDPGCPVHRRTDQ